jgi:hypothetical protein
VCHVLRVLWLFIGTIFYVVHEGRTIGEAVYYSISVGYGIFWLSVDSNVLSATFTRIHFCLGMVAIGLMMVCLVFICLNRVDVVFKEFNIHIKLCF